MHFKLILVGERNREPWMEQINNNKIVSITLIIDKLESSPTLL